MTVLIKILHGIDWLSEKSGQVGKWFALLLVLVGSFETISRHFFNAPTIWAYDSMCMAGGVIYLLGASYNYLHDAHTRVDLFYMRGVATHQGPDRYDLRPDPVFSVDDHHVQAGGDVGGQGLADS